MREYTVMGGDTPALIAAKFAGCPRCAIDLVAENPEKEVDVKPNGYVTFKSLKWGDKLKLPDKWFTKEFDELPPSYFASLSHPDGKTMPARGVGSVGLLSGALGAPFSAALTSAAQAAANAIAADPSYCTSVRTPGSVVNGAVHNFKTQWNASQQPQVPINTGNYESSVSAALAQVLGSAPRGCDAAAAATPAAVPATTTKTPLSTGAVVGIGLLIAGTVGGVAYVATHRKQTRRHIRRIKGRVQRRFRR